MYTATKRQKKHKIFLRFVLIVLPIIVFLVVLVWYVFLRDNSSSANFARVGAEVAVVKPTTKDFTNQFFKVTLPSSWSDLGRKNPYSDQVYYEFQNTQKDYDNRWLRVYVDVFPKSFAINKLLPVTIANNKVIPDVISDECSTFTGAPLSNGQGQQQTAQTWAARYKNIDFVCDMANPRNYVGTASVEQGYATTLTSKNGAAHKYFFVYIDHNIHPDYQVFTDALKSFETQ